MASDWFEDGDLLVDFRRCRVWQGDREIHTSALRFRILCCLVKNAGRPLTSREILRHAWEDAQYDTGLVRWHIARLRRELGDVPPKRIVHLRGFGYRYDSATLQEHTPSTPRQIDSKLKDHSHAPKPSPFDAAEFPARSLGCYQICF